jgi:hypothetical protein
MRKLREETLRLIKLDDDGDGSWLKGVVNLDAGVLL